MISESNELELRLEKKDKYARNLAEALNKLGNESDPRCEIKKLENLINFYNIDEKFRSRRFDRIEIDANSGFPTKTCIEKLFKDKKIFSNSRDFSLNEKIKEYFNDENINLEEIRKKYGLKRYFDEIKKLDTFSEFNDVSLRNESISISNYQNNRFSYCRIFFNKAFLANAEKFSDYMKNQEESSKNDKPKYLSTMYQKMLSCGIIPESMEKHMVGPFYTKKTGNENYRIRAMIDDEDSYVLEYKREKVLIEKKEIKKREFIFAKKEIHLEKTYNPDFSIYASDDKMKLKLLDILSYSQNIRVV